MIRQATSSCHLGCVLVYGTWCMGPGVWEVYGRCMGPGVWEVYEEVIWAAQADSDNSGNLGTTGDQGAIQVTACAPLSLR